MKKRIPESKWTIEEEALFIAAQGFPIFLVNQLDKDGRCDCGRKSCIALGYHALTRNGHLDATTDTERLKELFEKNPDADYGIRTGKEFDFLAVELSGEDASALGFYIGGLDHYVEIGVQGDLACGGSQLYFLWPEDDETLVKNVELLKDIIDIRIAADNDYIIAPLNYIPPNRDGILPEWDILDPMPEFEIKPDSHLAFALDGRSRRGHSAQGLLEIVRTCEIGEKVRMLRE